MTGVLIKREIWRQTSTEGGCHVHMKTDQDVFTCQGMPTISRNHQKEVKREAWGGFLLIASEGPNPGEGTSEFQSPEL